MDKETLSNYGWIVICVLVLAVIIALATPFGNFIADGFKATFLGFGQTNNTTLDTMYDTTGTPPSVEHLQSKYKFEYYSSLNDAVNDVNNGTIGINADANKEDAVAGIYADKNGAVSVVLLKDTTEATKLKPMVDMTINLGGHTLSSDDVLCIDVLGGNLTIDGRLSGSEIRQTKTGAGACVQIRNTSAAERLFVNGGTYSAASENGTKYTFNLIKANVKAELHNCEIIASTGQGDVYGIWVTDTATANIINSNITASSGQGTSYGIVAKGEVTVTNSNTTASSGQGTSCGIVANGEVTVTNSNVKAYANYVDDYSSFSSGISNHGILTLNNCYVIGTLSGVSNAGTLYVNGGTFESYGHGGIYFAGTGTTAYVRNATLKDMLTMPEGWEGTSRHNGAGFYIGGNVGMDNISVYMDNCKIYGSESQIVLRGSSEEKNNTLYISNSNLYDLNGDTLSVRIDNDTHKLYLGTGNNFTADNTTRPSAVITTNETYTPN